MCFFVLRRRPASHVPRVVRLLVLVLVLPAVASSADFGVELVPVVAGLDSPVALTHAPGDGERMFVTERAGRIRIIRDGLLVAAPFLDIADRVRSEGEQGLLSVAFHPLYEANGAFFVNYTNASGSTVISRLTVRADDPDSADAASEEILLTIPQPFTNHNGGQIHFGPDGYLYIGMGDGGSGGDPGNRAQNLLELLGKMLRIDVDGGTPYAIPPDNPYAFTDSAKPEIWASGLRNPWRFSFDRLTGDVFIADVGQARREEVNFQPGSSHGGENYGWRIMEGSACSIANPNCSTEGLTFPILEYSHSTGCSVTGGYVYRGSTKWLQGIYFYGDYCAGTIWGAVRRIDGTWENVVEIPSTLFISSFGEDLAGEIYVVDLAGAVYRIENTIVRRRAVRR